jgi:hypothetical protein
MRIFPKVSRQHASCRVRTSRAMQHPLCALDAPRGPWDRSGGPSSAELLSRTVSRRSRHCMTQALHENASDGPLRRARAIDARRARLPGNRGDRLGGTWVSDGATQRILAGESNSRDPFELGRRATSESAIGSIRRPARGLVTAVDALQADTPVRFEVQHELVAVQAAQRGPYTIARVPDERSHVAFCRGGMAVQSWKQSVERHRILRRHVTQTRFLRARAVHAWHHSCEFVLRQSVCVGARREQSRSRICHPLRWAPARETGGRRSRWTQDDSSLQRSSAPWC